VWSRQRGHEQRSSEELRSERTVCQDRDTGPAQGASGLAADVRACRPRTRQRVSRPAAAPSCVSGTGWPTGRYSDDVFHKRWRSSVRGAEALPAGVMGEPDPTRPRRLEAPTVLCQHVHQSGAPPAVLWPPGRTRLLTAGAFAPVWGDLRGTTRGTPRPLNQASVCAGSQHSSVYNLLRPRGGKGYGSAACRPACPHPVRPK
jgi:hypothetical protein